MKQNSEGQKRKLQTKITISEAEKRQQYMTFDKYKMRDEMTMKYEMITK